MKYVRTYPSTLCLSGQNATSAWYAGFDGGASCPGGDAFIHNH